MTRATARRRRGAALAASLSAVALLVGAACSVPEDGRPRTVEYSRLPDDLAAPTASPEPTPLITQEVLIYLIDENNLLSPVARDVASPARPIAVLEALFSAPNETESEQALTTALPADVEVSSVDIDPSNDLVVVALESEVFEERLEGENRQLAVAQLVFTATQNTGSTRFSLTLNGNPVPLPTDSGESDVPVTRDDFYSLDPEYQPEPTPEPTPVETPTATEPPTPTVPPEAPSPTPTPPVVITPTPEPGPTLPPGIPPDFTLDLS
ncbi:GerMN domain-containing protein [Candidatus Poriferisocius sp.]|uniref:GerMN domain-containing protein n=1 Tax=Candidatus Poriferisocius sp. TaxID=3101276 RepID=UPI003B020C33